MRFEHCYSQPLCTPSRVKIMTGMSNVRNYVQFGVLKRDQTTFAHLLKKAGYATCIVGKWQLGKEADSPQHFGFDESCLWQHTRPARDQSGRDTRYPNPCLEVNGKPVDYTSGEYGPDVVTDFLCGFMERNKDQPFLGYYPMILPHNPFVPTPDSEDPNCRDHNQNYQDMVAYIDKVVGKLAAKLDELGIRDNTLILFTCDNGSAGAIKSQLNGNMVQGAKGTMTDAGTHVPMIASWPGTIHPGKVSQDLVDFSDFLPTLCAAAGASIPETLSLDGQSFLPQLRGEEGHPREWIYCYYSRGGGKGEQWARNQRYKLYPRWQSFMTSARTGWKKLHSLSSHPRLNKPAPRFKKFSINTKRPAHLRILRGRKERLKRSEAKQTTQHKYENLFSKQHEALHLLRNHSYSRKFSLCPGATPEA